MFPGLDTAIGNFEGFGQPGTIATRQNNPGNLVYGPFAQNMGATGAGTNNIAVFPDSQTGYSAMDNLIQQYAGNGYNIQQLIGAWAPPNAPGNSQQSTTNYTNYVAQQAGVTPNTPVSALANGQNVLNSAAAQQNALGQWLSNHGIIPSPNSPKGQQIQKQMANAQPATFTFSRIAAIGVGLIAIAGSIYLFKSSSINGIIGSGSLLVA